jgi:hypothetical protein
MKKIVIVLALISSFYAVQAQDEEKSNNDEKKGGFKKENLFTGGGAIVSVGSYSTLLGASPVFGYSFTKWLDAGISFNYNYASARYVYFNGINYVVSDEKARQNVIGPGIFARFYPVKFLFINVQAEHNYTTEKQISPNQPTLVEKYDANSLLIGVGYANGRQGTGDFYYYISVMADVAGNVNSPYVGISESGKAVITPIFKAGIQVPLFQGKRNRF